MTLSPALSHRLVVLRLAVAAAPRFLASAMDLVHGRPRAALGLFFGHATLFVPLFDVFCLTLFFVCVFALVASRHDRASHRTSKQPKGHSESRSDPLPYAAARTYTAGVHRPHRRDSTMTCSQLCAAALAGASVVLGAQTPDAGQDVHRRLFSLGDFRLESGVVLPGARIAYATFGTLNAQRDNAILLPSWYGSDHHGYDFLIGAGRALDPAKYFLVATEMFANGFSSSPSNTRSPFDGPAFPAIAIRDNVEAARRLLSELGVTHVRAVVGFSMGAQQAFQWAVSHPDFVPAIAAYCG